MMEYIIVKREFTEVLAVEVETHLNNGWKLHGELKVAPHPDGGGWYLQALTKGNPNA